MKLVAHLIASDVRRFKWLLLAWLLLEATATTLSGIQPTYSATARLFDLLGIVMNLLWLAEFLLLFVIIPLVVQSDPLVGTDAFWMTRPIPWRALLAAKVILLWVLIAAVPVAAEAAPMAAYHVPISALLRVVAQNIVYQTLWVMALMAAAAITPTLARYALLFVGLVIGIALLGAITALIETGFGTRAPLLFGLPEPGNPTASLLLLLLLTAAGFTTTAVQYAMRSRTRSVVVGVFAVIVAIYAAPQWRWSLFGEAPEAPAWAREQSALRLVGDASTVRADLPSDWDYSVGENVVRLVRARVRVDALPPGCRRRLADAGDRGFLGAAVGAAGREVRADYFISARTRSISRA